MEYNNSIKRKINQYFKERWGAKDYRNGWLKADCPFCGKHKFGINISKSKANCFSCGDHKSPLRVIGILEELETLPKIFNFLRAFEGTDFLEPKVELREWKKVELPESFKLLSLGKSILSESARNYMVGRGFNIRSLTMKGIGYCTGGKYAGYIIFPFYQNGKLIYFMSRQYLQLWVKFKNPAVEDFGIGKSMLTYNVDALLIYKKIYLVESVTNALTMGDNAVATLGKKISGYQLSMIIKSPVEEVIIGYDDDAIMESIKLGMDLINHKRVKLLLFPLKKDINQLGKKSVRKLEKNSPWLTYNDLLKLKNKHETTIYSYI